MCSFFKLLPMLVVLTGSLTMHCGTARLARVGTAAAQRLALPQCSLERDYAQQKDLSELRSLSELRDRPDIQQPDARANSPPQRIEIREPATEYMPRAAVETMAFGGDVPRDTSRQLARRKLGRRRSGNAEAVRDAVARWSDAGQSPTEPPPEPPPADEQDAESKRAAEAMLEGRSRADVLAALGLGDEETNTLLQKALDAEAEAAVAVARAAELRAAADTAVAKLEAEAEARQMSDAMAAWSDKFASEQGEEDDLRAAMQAAMGRAD